MKKLVLVLAITVSLLGVVSAGSDTYSGKEMKQVVQPAPVCPPWAGFYVGIQGGYNRAIFDPDLGLEGNWLGFSGRLDTLDAARGDFGVNGGNLGGVLGYNFTFTNLLLGLEFSGAYTWVRDSRVDNFTAPNSNPWRLSTSVDQHYFMTVGPRVGWTFCRFTPFVTGGAAFSDIDFHQSITFSNGRLGNATEGGSTSDGHVGWFVGGGLEYAITDHWHIRGDYKYADFGGHDSFTADFAAPLASAPMHSKIDLREHVATAAIVYQF